MNDARTSPTPLADVADAQLRALAAATGSAAIAALDGATLLGERAMLGGFRVPGRTSAGGGCRLFDTLDDALALNLSRPDDRDLLPALFETDTFDPRDDARIARLFREGWADALVARGRSMGLAIAGETEPGLSIAAETCLSEGMPRDTVRQRPRVLDLSALWAGPLAGHLLALTGAEVVKVESRTRPDAMRHGDPALYTLLNAGKAERTIDFAEDGRRQLLALIAEADIVIEAARPRALRQLDVAAEALVTRHPGLVWITITGHGAQGDEADWVGFGDDCGVAAGLSAALRAVSGKSGFVGDAIADPLTGIRAASAAWQAWRAGLACRIGLSMRAVVTEAMADAPRLDDDLRRWAAAEGRSFPDVAQRQPLPAVALPDWAAPC